MSNTQYGSPAVLIGITMAFIFVFTATAPLYALPGGGITADGLGTVVTPGGSNTYDITGGTIAGNNLFHSFSEFNVETDETANFVGNQSLTNIFVRVTGGNDSWIDGTIKTTNTNANIYVMNPNGVMFGPNASYDTIDMNGSSHVSTADYIGFADGAEFHADSGSTLTGDGPSAFGFEDSDVGPISVNGSQLAVPVGETISLIGGDVTVRNGAEVKAPGGCLNIAAVKGPGEVVPTADDLDTGAISDMGDIRMEGGSELDVSGVPGGSIFIRGGAFVVTGADSRLRNESSGPADSGSIDVASNDIVFTEGAEIYSFTSGQGAGGGITLKGAGTVSLSASKIDARTIDTGEGAGDGGSIEVSADDIVFLDGALIIASTYGKGRGGGITLNAAGSVTFSGEATGGTPSRIYTETHDTGEGAGDGGSIEVSAHDLFFSDGAGIMASTYGKGRGGGMILDATGLVTFSGESTGGTSSGIYTETYDTEAGAGDCGSIEVSAYEIAFSGATVLSKTDGSGQSGNVDLTASTSIVVSDNSQVDVRTDSDGNGGNLSLQAPDIRFEGGAQILSLTDGAGKGGNVLLEGENIIFDNSGGIDAGAFDTGDGGDVTVVAEETFRLTGGQPLYAGSDLGSTGSGGDLLIEAKDIIIDGGAQIEVKTHGPGHGGTATFKADTVTIQGGSHITSSSTGAGDSRAITVEAAAVELTGGSTIASESETGGGDSGTVTVRANDTIDITGGSALFTSMAGTGDGGSIQLQGGEIRIEGSEIKTESTSTALDAGDAGDILVEADDLITLDAGSSISSVAAGGGSAGNVTVNVNNGATLQGTGNIMGTVIVNAGGTLAPGETPGILSTGDLTLSAGATLFLELSGTIVGDDYDQVDVTGAVDLGGAALDVAVGFTPSPRQTFAIVENDGSDPVVNTFNGLDEGALFNSRGSRFRITYRGGDGNDVVLTYFPPYVPYMLLLETPSRRWR